MRIISLILAALFVSFGVKPVFGAVSFTISNPQQDGDQVVIDVALSGLTSSSCPNTYCYLQAAFTSPSPVKYFGFTKNHSGQWYEYISSPDTQYIQSTFFAFTPNDGAWSGQITIKLNPNDPDYNGSGSYNIKAWRYTGNSSSASGSTNPLLVTLTGPTPVPTVSATSAPTPTPTPNPTSKPTSIPTPKKTTAPSPTISTATPLPTEAEESTKKIALAAKPDYKIASVAAASTSSQPASTQIKPLVKEAVGINPLIWVGIFSLFAGAGGVGYIYLKSNGKLHFPFRKRN